MTKRKPKSEHKKDGRPSTVTHEVVAKLEEAFKAGLSDELACIDAGISEDAFYRYCKKRPKFRERKEQLKRTPEINARKKLGADTSTVGGARYYAEHKLDDFVPKSKLEHAGKIQTEDVAKTEAMKALGREYEEKLKQEIIKGRTQPTPAS